MMFLDDENLPKSKVLTSEKIFDTLDIAKNTRPALHGGFLYLKNRKIYA